MITELTAEAVEFGLVASRAIEAAGGDRLVEQAEADPRRRDELVVPVLAELGVWDLEAAADPAELEAAAAVCRSAGRWALPYPVAERLARPTDLDVDGLVVVAGPRPVAALEGVAGRWVATDLAGRRRAVTTRPSTQSARKGAFVVGLDLDPIDDAGGADVARALVLPCWTLLGMLDRALDLTCTYVQEREQFGQKLAGFQSVQFQLTDAEVERTGAEQLANYALWSAQTDRPEALDDALALRLAVLDAAEVVFRIAHQLHGAIGFCDEASLSWISRHSQPLRRLPMGRTATTEALATAVGSRGLTGLYSGAPA